MISKAENPWHVESIYTMQYYVCPSCTYKHVSKQNFVCHAFDIHPESVDFMKNIEDGSLSDILCPWDTNHFKNEEEDRIDMTTPISNFNLHEFEEDKLHPENDKSIPLQISKTPDILLKLEKKTKHEENDLNGENFQVITDEFQTIEEDIGSRSIDPFCLLECLCV